MDAPLSRRDLLLTTLATPALAALAADGRENPVVRENRLPGTRDWLLPAARIDPATRYRCPWIEGYCSHTSVAAGERLSIFVSTDPVAPFTVDVYRLGHYGGAGGRHVRHLGRFPGRRQPDPPIGERRLRECRWDATAEITIPDDWPSGVYVARLTRDDAERISSYATFVVRDDRAADFIVQVSDTTWQAYNRWPSQFSLYDDGKSQWYWGPGFEVSFDRPYGKYCQIMDQPLSTGSGEFFCWEFPLAFWLEELGYDVTYISNLDLHSRPETLKRARGFLSVGHDEYYTIGMFDHLKAAIDAGLNVAFLSGNTCCGRIELKPSSDGRPNRIMSRVDRFGPRDPIEISHFPAMALLPYVSPNENTLIGARSTGAITGGADYACSMPGHWLFDGTGMKHGDAIPGLVGWEWHGDPAKIPGLQIVSTGPARTKPNGPVQGTYTSTIYPGPRGNLVFNASSCWWADGLSAPPGYVRPKVYTEPKGPDPRVQRITRNLLERMRQPRG